MILHLERDVSPISSIGWKCTNRLTGDASFGKTRNEAIWPVAQRSLTPGQSASVVEDGQLTAIVTRPE